MTPECESRLKPSHSPFCAQLWSCLDAPFRSEGGLLLFLMAAQQRASRYAQVRSISLGRGGLLPFGELPFLTCKRPLS